MSLGIAESTVVRHFGELREVCVNKCSFNEKKIGGEGHEVELDVTKIFHIKYNQGRLLFGEKTKSWVIGGIDRSTNMFFAELVESRSSEVIEQFITKRVKPKTRLLTDQWRAYLCLRKLDYTVEQVNHSLNFLNPGDPTINTQKIERTWRSLKQYLPKTAHGKGRSIYIEEIVYRKSYLTKNTGLNFKTVINDIAEFYSGCFLD